MRVIFYVMDGVSAVKIRSFCSDEENRLRNPNVKETYIDQLYKTGFAAKHCYGFDNTQASFYALFTGRDYCRTSVSITQHADLFMDYDFTLASLFKEKGFRTHYYSSNYCKAKVIPYRGIDKCVFDFGKYNLEDSSIAADKNFWGLNGSNGNTFLVIHDYYVHDYKGQFVKGKLSISAREYEDLIVEQGGVLRRNLEFIEYDPSVDYLVLLSDHGMTVDTDELIKKGRVEKYYKWSLPSGEMKSRVVFMVVGPGIEHREYTETCSLLDVFPTLSNMFGLQAKGDGINLFSDKPRGDALLLNLGNIFTHRTSYRKYTQFAYIKSREKWVYQPNINEKTAEFYDLSQDILEEHPKYIRKNQLPDKLLDYVEEYERTRKPTAKAILAFSYNLFHMYLIYRIKTYVRRIKGLLCKKRSASDECSCEANV